MPRRVYDSLQSASARTGVSVQTLRRRIAAGDLPIYRWGRIVRLDPDDVDALFSRWPLVQVAGSGRRAPR